MRFKNTKVLRIKARGAGNIAAASSYVQVEVNGKRVETKPALGEYPVSCKCNLALKYAEVDG